MALLEGRILVQLITLSTATQAQINYERFVCIESDREAGVCKPKIITVCSIIRLSAYTQFVYPRTPNSFIRVIRCTKHTHPIRLSA